jgi:flagellin
MGLRILTNVPSLTAQGALATNQLAQTRSMNKLSTGERIVQAGDDAAGLSISERIRAQIRSQKQAQRNANDAVSMIQTAEGGLSEIGNNLIRLRELAVQSASDTIGDRERGFIELEVFQIKAEIDRISDATGFNGIQMLNGEAIKSPLIFQVGSFNVPADKIEFDVNEINSKTDSLGVDGISLADIDSAEAALEVVDDALDKVNGYRATLGALQNRLNSTAASLGTNIESLAGAGSRIRDVDYAEESAELIKRRIVSEVSVAVLAQANQMPAQALRLL